MTRQLKNITVSLQWILPRMAGTEQGNISNLATEQGAIESSVFAASSAYNADELVNLLQSSGSSLSLTLDTSSDDTASVVWQPETERSLEPRASFSQILTGLPPQDQFGRLRHTDTLMSSTATLRMLQAQKTRRSRLRYVKSSKVPNMPFSNLDPSGVSATIISLLQIASQVRLQCRFKSQNVLTCVKMAASSDITLQLTSDVQDIVGRVTAISELMQVFFDQDGGPEGLPAIWPVMEASVREYFDYINRALYPAKKRAGLSGTHTPPL